MSHALAVVLSYVNKVDSSSVSPLQHIVKFSSLPDHFALRQAEEPLPASAYNVHLYFHPSLCVHQMSIGCRYSIFPGWQERLLEFVSSHLCSWEIDVLAMTAGGPMCEVCKESQARYKCPGCQMRTCSLQCSKGHKSISGILFTPEVKP